MHTCKLMDIIVSMYGWKNKLQTQIKWEYKNDVNYMDEVAPASAMLILPTDGLSNPNIRDTKYEMV